MQIVCPKCHTKYSLPDEKVAGKILKVRCKKCGNVIVVRGTKDVLEKKKREHRERITSSRARAVLRQAFEEDSGAFPDEEMEHSERTQIAMMPKLEDFSQEAEWYLADSRGQFGPMSFQELVARLKRGEPEADAVVWREGFEDWRPIEEVPELKPHYKPAPPPRKEKKEESGPVADVAAPGSQPVPSAQQPAVSGPIFPATESQIITQRNMRPEWQTKLVPFLVGGMVIGAIAFFAARAFMKPQVVEKVKVVEKVVPPPPQQAGAAPSSPRIRIPDSEDEYEIALDDGQDQGAGSSAVKKHTHKIHRNSPGPSPSSDIPVKDSAPVKQNHGRTKKMLDSVRQHSLSGIKRCYRLAKRRGMTSFMDSKITFHVVIPPGGVPSKVTFTGKLPITTKKCFSRAIKQWKFPQGTKTDVYSFTMVFN